MINEWPGNTIQVNGIRISYHRTGDGSGKPPLLLLHGFSDNALCWGPVARELLTEFDVIMPDARGHGRTRGDIQEMRVGLLAADTAAFIEALGIAPAYVFGHSMGGVTALALAVEFPALVRAAVLEDPPLMLSYPIVVTPEDRVILDNIAQNAAGMQRLSHEERIVRGRLENPGWPDEEIIPWAAAKGEYDLGMHAFLPTFRDYPWREAIPRVACPILLLVGDPVKSALVTPAVAREAASLNSRVEIAEVDGAGHCIHRDKMSETMALVKRFLRREA